MLRNARVAAWSSDAGNAATWRAPGRRRRSPAQARRHPQKSNLAGTGGSRKPARTPPAPAVLGPTAPGRAPPRGSA
eukprot:2192371-Lingulodinium_polyedra.AAC.1